MVTILHISRKTFKEKWYLLSLCSFLTCYILSYKMIPVIEFYGIGEGFSVIKLPRSTPEKQGIPSESISGFLRDLSDKSLELHSFMFLRNGHVVSEGWWDPYKPELPHMLFSLSKSFTSTAVGFAVSEGLLSVDDTVASFFDEYVPKDGFGKVPDSNLAAMKVRHLLSMSTGHAEDTTGRISGNPKTDGNWVKAFLSLPVEYVPGTHFVYNSGASYMLSAIVQKLTGQTVLDYLTPRLFQPLGIEGATWESCPLGINCGGWGLSIRTEDIAKFGQLYLQEGVWEGRQILPKEWVQEATGFHIENGNQPDSDWSQGYGYQFWRCRHNAYRGDGAFGQYCIVMPDKNAVIAITSGLDNMQAVLNSVWEHLLPAMGEAGLPENKQSFEKLQQTLSSLALLPPEGKTSSPLADSISGKTYTFEKNDLPLGGISFDFAPGRNQIRIQDNISNQTVLELDCGTGHWLENQECPKWVPGKIMAGGIWTEDNTYTVIVRFIETPFYYTFRCRFEGDSIQLNTFVNVSFGPKEMPAVHGKLLIN
jgi:CubicO group peptidase (beta-lactamase class C family)